MWHGIHTIRKEQSCAGTSLDYSKQKRSVITFTGKLDMSAFNSFPTSRPKIEHTDVVIVGNGPSALALSYMLAGNRPYYDGTLMSNEFLTRRLQEDSNISIVDKDLAPLCEGLDGRSNNPVALLFDSLYHPDADLGTENPSVLEWKHESQYTIPHVVLGKTKPGGTWQKIDGTMQTISQNTWMELPNVPFKEWLAINKRASISNEVTHGRATVGDVKDYYCDYVRSQGLTQYFMDFHTVTSVQRVYHLRHNAVDSESGEVEPCCRNVRRNHTHCWEVRGYRAIVDGQGEQIDRQEFCYMAPHVVLATGTYDVPNRLGVGGENLPFVSHSLGKFESHLVRGLASTTSDPVLVVGAGLSAADAILMALEANIPVIHMFHRGPKDPSLIFSKLPKTMYPEYHHIHSLMKGLETSELYKPVAKHSVIEILENKVLARAKDCKVDTVTTFAVSCVAIMIGSRSDLGFLAGEGRDLGIVPKWAIDCKHNPIDVDEYSYQSNKEPQLFAMGPLVGDSFVRFGIGGALGIVNHLKKCHKKDLL